MSGNGADRRVVAWSGGDERAMVVEHGYTWTRMLGTDVEARVLADRPVALHYGAGVGSAARKRGYSIRGSREREAERIWVLATRSKAR